MQRIVNLMPLDEIALSEEPFTPYALSLNDFAGKGPF